MHGSTTKRQGATLMPQALARTDSNTDKSPRRGGAHGSRGESENEQKTPTVASNTPKLEETGVDRVNPPPYPAPPPHLGGRTIMGGMGGRETGVRHADRSNSMNSRAFSCGDRSTISQPPGVMGLPPR
jgi:hypothetical protein